ncbi:SPOR domain-containing protein [Algivirga pacifica]
MLKKIHIFKAITAAILLTSTPILAQEPMEGPVTGVAIPSGTADTYEDVGKITAFNLKKKVPILREQKQRLLQERESLMNQNKQLSSENQSLMERVVELEQNIAHLDAQLTQMQPKVQAYEEMQVELARQDSLKKAGVPAPDDNRFCAKKHGKLQVDRSYFTDLKSQVISNGWGLQIYSSPSLCDAQEVALQFEASHNYWKTYVKVKEIDGQTMYAVIYGSLKYKEQAQYYCNQFIKKVAKTEGELNAFLVQH